MDKIVIKEDVIPEIDQLMYLYNDVEWSAYTDDRISLQNAINNSLKVLTAWDNRRLVGLIRVVGDGCSIIYIQDILVLKDYQGQGIGSSLLRLILEHYKIVRQIVLLTDQTKKTINFYEKNGMINVKDYDCAAFVKLNIK